MAATRKHTSPVWQFFELKEIVSDDKKKKKAVCKLCDGLQLAYGGGTTNLQSHLRAKHYQEYNKALGTAETGPKQTTLSGLQSKRCPPDRADKISSLIAEFVSRDLRPIAVVDGRGFQQLMNFVEPGYKVPSRPYVTKVCHKLYDSLKEDVAKSLVDKHIAITTDLWTSRATESYITVTAHFVDEGWNLQNKVLLTQAMPEKHTGINIAERLRDSVKEWNIDENNISAVVRDNARNMDVAMVQLGWPDVPCFAHTLQLAVNNGLDLAQVSRVTAVARKLVGHFKHSAVATTTLKDKQKQLNAPQHHLIQDVVTRWNSTFFMMERLLEQRWSIYAVLHDENRSQSRYKNLYLNEGQWQLAEQLVKVLKPLQVATTALCESEIVSVSLVYPVIHGLLTNHLCVNPDDLPPVKNFKEKVTTEITCRFTPGSLEIEDNAPILAAAVDPHYHQLKFLSIGQCSVIRDSLRMNVEKMNSQLSQDNENEPPTPKKKKETALSFLLGEQQEDATEDEIDRFLREPILSPEVTTLEWWRKNAERFPTLACVAKRHLCIPATSVPAERVFSTAGLIINHKRSSLLPENADMLIFLNKNLPKK